MEPAWPLLALQMSRRPDTGVDACDVTLAAVAAGLTAMQALALIDHNDHGAGRHDQAQGLGQLRQPTAEELPTIDGTLEMTISDLRLRRRSWSIHPSCPCHSARLLAAACTGEAEDKPAGGDPDEDEASDRADRRP